MRRLVTVTLSDFYCIVYKKTRSAYSIYKAFNKTTNYSVEIGRKIRKMRENNPPS